MARTKKTIWAYCNGCARETKHFLRCSSSVLREDSFNVGNDIASIEEKEIFEILQCLGCEEMLVRQHFENEALGESAPTFYPPRTSRRTPIWKDKLPSKILAVVEEVYRALQADSPRLATIGTRTIIDLVLVDKVGDVGTFGDKLRALETLGYIGTKNREFVAVALEAGSAAAHRGLAPAIENLNHVMDIVESLLESVYVFEDVAEHVRLSTPPRKKY